MTGDVYTTHRPMTAARKRKYLGLTLRHVLMCALVLLTVFPFFAMLVISIQPGQAITLPGSMFPTEWSFSAYVEVLRSSRVPRWFLNSAIYAVVSVVLTLIIASAAAYGFAKKRFRGRDFLFWLIVATLMIPGQLTLIPLFLIVGEMGGHDTFWGLLVPTLANVQAIFLMRQFVMGIPDELIDAAKIDGANEFRVWWQIVMPQTKPILATLATFVFLGSWNEFLWPLVMMNSPDNYLLTVGLQTLQQEIIPLATMMASASVLFLPTLLVFYFAQKHFVANALMSGLK